MDLQALHNFIVRAKSATYVGDGQHSQACRPASHDLQFSEGEWSYLDSYFGGTDFIGEEAVYYQGKPVWAMNYYGRILRPELVTAVQAGQMIKASLSKMYQEGRFLGGFRHSDGNLTYVDTSEGEFTSFTGKEWIEHDGVIAYDLLYHGGLIKD